MTLVDHDADADTDGTLARLPVARTQAAPRVAMIGTYLPRRCGIATFTADTARSLSAGPRHLSVDIYALTHAADRTEYPDAAATIDGSTVAGVRCAAEVINRSGVEAVWIQHEFGIFGGQDGERVIDLAQALAAPLIVTFHTVLKQPSPNQRRIVEYLLQRASRVMVMSRSGREVLISTYGARPAIVRVIPHGAPDRPFVSNDRATDDRGERRPVLMTFGLLGPGKGLETAIAALPAIRADYPGLLYRIVGITHPDLVAREGEAYREKLMALAEQLGVAGNVEWVNGFLETEELLDQLAGCDIYLTPYLNLQQSTSGTLSYAVALGRAIVSTPYEHAREVLGDGAGVLIDPGDSDAIATAVRDLLDDPVRFEQIRQRAYAKGRETIWPAFGRAATALVEEAVSPLRAPLPAMAPPSGDALFHMSDGVGLLQHGIGVVPDRRHGYCLDDNVRALIAMHDGLHLPAGDRRRWTSVYASFVQHAWNPERQTFRNFMSFDRRWCEEEGSHDSFGRALWGLGVTAHRASGEDMRAWGLHWFDEALPGFERIDSPRSLALAAQGAASVLRGHPLHQGARDLLERTGQQLLLLLEISRRPRWPWFEVVLGYDNPRLPQALLLAGEALQQPDWIAAGLDTLRWICERQTSAAGLFRPVGSESFGLAHTQLPFDQQPLEAQAAIEAALTAHALTGDAYWARVAERSWQWFFGANDRGVALADLTSGRCRDGVTPRGANLNCGAESILALHASFSAMRRLREARLKAGGQLRHAGEEHGGPTRYGAANPTDDT
ncbi:MAG: glycosyltransferase family 4 protein [Alteraurantiacibacter sp.]